jgi:GTP cyclohydrolase I
MGYGHRRSLVPPIRQVLIQVQEKMTAEIAKEQRFETAWSRVWWSRLRMNADERGAQAVRQMVTSCLLGTFRPRPETRQEVLSAINLKGGL